MTDTFLHNTLATLSDEDVDDAHICKSFLEGENTLFKTREFKMLDIPIIAVYFLPSNIHAILMQNSGKKRHSFQSLVAQKTIYWMAFTIGCLDKDQECFA